MNPYQAISTIMTRKPIRVFDTDNYYKVQSIFRNSPIHHLPVINAEEKIVGIISKTDTARVNRSLNLETTGQTYSSKMLMNLKAKDIMTLKPATLTPEDTIGFAADIFLVNRFHALPIVDDDELVGIITSHDLLGFAFDKISIPDED